ncbi:EFR1 family ferrodoxin [Paenibacillus durus]|uniref:4Fe-4S ferredoxin n=1 Tax=Paenibacillus durus ATCC 35681 TaxID=1333534 RepID=A0A0F7CH48_PAEDU|nr:EFR1 family ferrodoxin [Paenibacillus durus]AKG34106.1 4Fe-4S ferredoxin [Paenibacillus durus ATCC 35681]
MIFYFSGTGNSLYAAKSIALHNNEELVSISAAVNTGNECFEYSLKDKERIGFVFPIYAWGPPKMVLEFIGKLKLNHYRDNYIFSVATCGGNIGNTMKVMDRYLKKKGMHLNGQFSIKMPNNYILMGDVDSEKVEKEKRFAADETLKRINPTIEQRTSGEFGLDKGLLAWLLTGFVNPMFNKNAMNTVKFHVNDHCTGCGICEKVCNCNTIHLVNKKPQWGKRCAQCLACIHYCPSKAIQYGKSTEKKGRYTHPEISYHEISMK